jgi:hypothetical protein
LNLEDIVLSEISQSQKDKYCGIPFYPYEVPRVGKFIETGYRMVVTNGRRRENELRI